MPLLPIGDLIDQSWEHYRRHFAELMSVSAWILVVAILDVIALAAFPSVSTLVSDASLSGMETVGVVLYGLASWLVAPLIILWVLASTVRLVRAQLSMRSGAVRESVVEGTRLVPALLVVVILVILALLAAVGIAFLPAAVLWLAATYLGLGSLYVVGTLALIGGTVAAVVLALRWSVRYYFAPVALLMDGSRGKSALTASRALMEGRFWPALARIAVPKLVFVVIALLAVAVISFVLSVMTDAFAGLNVDVQLRLNSISATVVTAIVAALINPLVVISDLLVYQGLKR